MNKKIKKGKSVNRNVYSVNDPVFNFLWFGFIGATAATILQPFFDMYSTLKQALIVVAITLAVALLGLIVTRKDKTQILPYTRKDNFNFIGLHNLTKETLGVQKNDILSRNEEVECIHETLENVIFPQSDIKQAMCITGESGCGKSTILAFFQQKYSSEYNIYNFSGNYNTLRAALQEQFDTTDVDGKIKELCKNGHKIVFIFDQFERYFFLTEERQLEIRNFITSLCMRNTAIIASMREEYLSEFLREFDLNDIKSNYKKNDEVEHKGLFRELIGYVKNFENFILINGSRRRITVSRWENENIKAPEFLHVSDPEGKKTIVDRTGGTVFYCENQNKMQVNTAGEKTNSSTMYSKCCAKFGEATGSTLYNLYCKKPLIEQQIIFHMAEFDNEFRGNDHSDEEFCVMETADIIKRYFDVQLVSTGDYFNASRVMYLLSSARLHQISMKTEDIIIGLQANQFSSAGRDQINAAIRSLESLQLIRKNATNSTLEYEIAHDYIATEFLSYSHANMDRNVKAALDIFLAGFIDDFEKSLISQKSDESVKKPASKYRPEKDRFYTVATFIVLALVYAIDIVFRFVWDPWKDASLNPFNGFMPMFIPVIVTVCVVYFYQFYDKIFKYHPEVNSASQIMSLKIEYMFMGIIVILFEVLYPHFAVIEGLGIFAIGTKACLILNKSYRESSRAAMFGYGIKCVVVGLVFIFAHLLFFISQNEFPTFLIVFEMVAGTMMAAYAHFAHMTKEYVYGRCMDVSGRKIK